MKYGFPLVARKTLQSQDRDLNTSVDATGLESDRNNISGSKMKKMNMDIDLGAGVGRIRHHATARANRNELRKESTWENAETPRDKGSDEELEPTRININSEDDLMSNYEINSNDSDFLEKVLPMPKLGKPACFCESGNYC